MANRFRGFARMLSNAKNNSTRKEGFGRRFSSTVEKPSKDDFDRELTKKIFGDNEFARARAERNKMLDRQADREFRMIALKGLSIGAVMGLVLGSVYSYLAIGWYPFKDALGGDKDYRNHALQDPPEGMVLLVLVPSQVQAMKFKD